LTEERRLAMSLQKRPPFTLKALGIAIKRPKVGPLLQVRFIFALAFAMFQSIFSLYAASKLKLSPQTTGYVLAYVGVISVLVQGIGVGLVTKRFKENTIIIRSMWLMFIGLAGWAVTPNLPVLLVIMLPLAVGGGMLNTVINSAITKAVTPEEIGGTLGISTSIESASRVIAPSAGGFLLQSLGAWAPGLVSAALMAWAILFTYLQIIRVKDPRGIPVEELSDD